MKKLILIVAFLVMGCFGGQYITVINTTSHDNVGGTTGSPTEYKKEDELKVKTTDEDADVKIMVPIWEEAE